jgi:hypothetical protein
MKYTKEEIKERLHDLLYDCLSTQYQESAIISLDYDEETEECIVKLCTHIVEEDDYVGFDSY